MQTITSLVHTHNSATTLDACLSSLAWCDVIYVIDMSSSDATLDIAKKHKAKVYEAKGSHTYADPIRNEYMEKVTTDWTLIVDSDEEVSPALASRLQELMLGTGINAYSLPRLNEVLGKPVMHTGYWPDYIVRFFKTGTATYPPEVHSQPVVTGKHEYLPADPKIAIIHHHYATISQFLSRLNTYTTLEVDKLIKEKRDYTPLLAFSQFFNEFHTRYFKLEGYKDGSLGLTLSLLSSVYQMIAYLKAWEVSKTSYSTPLPLIEGTIATACSRTSYWVSNEALRNTKNPLKLLFHKLRRKYYSN